MEISIIVDQGTIDFDKAHKQEEVKVKGIITSFWVKDDGISKALEKVEIFENLINAGLIDKETLEEAGYYELDI